MHTIGCHEPVPAYHWGQAVEGNGRIEGFSKVFGLSIIDVIH